MTPERQDVWFCIINSMSSDQMFGVLCLAKRMKIITNSEFNSLETWLEEDHPELEKVIAW